ncbi:MAG: vitamin B12-dependent ribonucleotide reductase [marine benthic group bacterium]|jgi:ribonucleoside-diphosphate reductase alpha chain|nr:vitamin B12-dependent ribonucleotide reductase [Gemmatimonadota bacterium]MCL7963550.1 vitamin B12-dependent ribonucleotide reductase [Candidatus Carthagonibacter metallireducens]MCL7936736.1 vitamin B12-dependent ribonucleotide reductase [Gemmatimonadota bacterium]MCL7958076.1 vitamin B12-dependent ribonucleotide reductase [Gemmatimonadota bacterium]MCL7965102.1 vitamin B12-dependent ribonucleotide reductase [Gemmatimonadota bacterium]
MHGPDTTVAPKTDTTAETIENTPADLPEPRLSENALTVLAKRYLKKDQDLEPNETPQDMFWRVARVIADVDARYGASEERVEQVARTFYEIMADGEFEPNSPTLMNAGRPLGQLSACFVLPVPDSLEGIYETLRDMALIHQSGGGTGFGFSRLRPSGDVVKSTMGVASGPVSFMEVYDASTEAVKQGGTRRGANMGILRVDHPDVLEFIDCKEEGHKITNFNISVAVTDDFMNAVERGESYALRNPRGGEPVGELDAREVFEKVVYGAWRNGEPGVYFIDEANRYNPVPHMGSYEATNPCGEQPLLPYDVCNLGSVNVGRFVQDGRIDWDNLRTAVHRATHFLDNVIDANQYPLPQIDELSKNIRRIGLGVMGWADMLVKLGEPYGSARSIELGRELMRFVDEEAKVESERLARERGVFPEWERSIWGPDDSCARDETGARIRPMRRLRNCNVTTVAPTGTISIIAGCSSGIEPLFAVAFMRNQAGVLMPDVNPEFVKVAKEGGWYSEELMRRIADEGHIHFDEVPEDVQAAFVTAHDVTPEQHIRMQAAFQQYTDSAISKTCNFPNGATVDDVRRIFELAYELDCKGVTVYRDGSRDAQVLSTGKTARKVAAEAAARGVHASPGTGLVDPETVAAFEKLDNTELAAELAGALARVDELQSELEEQGETIAALEGGFMKQPEMRKRPAILKGVTRKIDSPLGDMYVTINEDEEGRPFEVFVALGKAGGPAMADAEAIGRLISLALRSGISLRSVHKQLRGISSDRAVGFGANKVLSSPDAIAQVVERYLEEKEGIQQSLPIPEVGAAKQTNGGTQTAEKPVIHRFEAQAAIQFIGTCPDCGSSLEFAEGCMKCHACGYSECG